MSMMNNYKLEFHLRDLVKVDNYVYRVISIVVFKPSNKNKVFIRYKLEDIEDYTIRYLDINTSDNECIFYLECPFVASVLQEIEKKEYIDYKLKQAIILDVRGASKYDVADILNYKIYIDKDTNNYKYIEFKKGEKFYLNGNKISRDKISIEKFDSLKIEADISKEIVKNKEIQSKNKFIKLALGITFIFIFLVMLVVSIGESEIPLLIDTIKYDEQFIYLTSLSSKIDKEEEASVYKTNLDIEDTVKKILKEYDGQVLNVIEDTKEGSVAIITSNEYCLVYMGDSYKTFIQISSRKYIYLDGNIPYNSAFKEIISFYRYIYFIYCYDKDKIDFGSKSYFDDYKEENIDIDTNRFLRFLEE